MSGQRAARGGPPPKSKPPAGPTLSLTQVPQTDQELIMELQEKVEELSERLGEADGKLEAVENAFQEFRVEAAGKFAACQTENVQLNKRLDDMVRENAELKGTVKVLLDQCERMRVDMLSLNSGKLQRADDRAARAYELLAKLADKMIVKIGEPMAGHVGKAVALGLLAVLLVVAAGLGGWLATKGIELVAIPTFPMQP